MNLIDSNSLYKRTFGEALKCTAHTRGVGVRQLAKATRLPYYTIRNWWRGEIASPRNWRDILRVAQALGLSCDEVEALLLPTKHPSLRVLYEQAGAEDYSLFQPWLSDGKQTPRKQIVNSPAYSVPFVGRKKARQVIHGWLEQPDCRLVSIVGLEGMGKTRLAVQIAQEQLRLWDDVFFIVVGDLPLGQLVAMALGCSTDGSIEALYDQVSQTIGTRRLLFVLDDVANSQQVEALLSQLWATNSYVKVLLTGRKRLDLRYEWHYPLYGLNYSGLSEARQLFAYQAVRYRKRLAESEQVYVNEICRLVGDMPLAIELAASWLPLLSCQEIARELASELALLCHPSPCFPQGVLSSFLGLWEGLSLQEQDALFLLASLPGRVTYQTIRQQTDIPLDMLLRLADRAILYVYPKPDLHYYELHPLLRRFIVEELDKVHGTQ